MVLHCAFELAIKIVYLFLHAAHQEHLHITASVATVSLLGHIFISALLGLEDKTPYMICSYSVQEQHVKL